MLKSPSSPLVVVHELPNENEAQCNKKSHASGAPPQSQAAGRKPPRSSSAKQQDPAHCPAQVIRIEKWRAPAPQVLDEQPLPDIEVRVQNRDGWRYEQRPCCKRDSGGRSHVATPNAAHQPPRASSIRHETKTSSRGQTACAGSVLRPCASHGATSTTSPVWAQNEPHRSQPIAESKSTLNFQLVLSCID